MRDAFLFILSHFLSSTATIWHRCASSLDRDSEKIGTILYDLPIMSAEEVVKTADCIIIVSASYWDVIYKRIEFIQEEFKIPIYYPNGDRAKIEKISNVSNNSYWNVTYKDLLSCIKENDIISFDIFDTIIMRKVLSEEDIFFLVDLKLKNIGIDIDFKTVRKKAESELRYYNKGGLLTCA